MPGPQIADFQANHGDWAGSERPRISELTGSAEAVTVALALA